MCNTGCHACGHQGCCISSATCHAKCTSQMHICIRSEGEVGCDSCDKPCHKNNADPRCRFFRRTRGHLTWSANAQQLMDAQAGTSGNLPHMSQVPWQFTNAARTELTVDGVAYRRGYGFPGDPLTGESNNCLIDSIRQCLGNLQCDRTLVRGDLQAEFGDSTDIRGRVAHSTYLDVECHWKAILRSLFRHNTSGMTTTCESDDYCIVALYGDRPGNGIVLGSMHAAHRLVIMNWSDVHFDPCLRQ